MTRARTGTTNTRKKLATVAAQGDRLATLEKLMDVIARSIEDPSISDRDRTSYVSQLRYILKDIDEIKAARGIAEEIEAATKNTIVDEITARRKARAS